MNIFLCLTLLTVLIAVPGTIVSILQLIEWQKRYKESKKKFSQVNMQSRNLNIHPLPGAVMPTR